MKMTAFCCQQCFQSITTVDQEASKLWIQLCAYFVKFGGIFKLRENRVPGIIKHFRNLEKLGFISTADGPDAVSIIVNGYDIVEVDTDQICVDTFCLDRSKHESSWI